MNTDQDQPTPVFIDAPGASRHLSLGYQVNHLARLLATALRTRIEPLGVVPGQFAQLLALYDEDGLTQTELGERVRIDQSTIAHTLKRMERDGLVKRTRSETDRRQAVVRLTPKARALESALKAAAADVNALALAGLTGSEVSGLLSTLSRLVGNLAADELTVSPPDRK
ncbi:MAG: MarR family transcriptional regulator [Trueperaceae bacterium]|jgi:DNA-binding MarR family transcriptional regulator